MVYIPMILYWTVCIAGVAMMDFSWIYWVIQVSAVVREKGLEFSFLRAWYKVISYEIAQNSWLTVPCLLSAVTKSCARENDASDSLICSFQCILQDEILSCSWAFTKSTGSIRLCELENDQWYPPVILSSWNTIGWSLDRQGVWKWTPRIATTNA